MDSAPYDAETANHTMQYITKTGVIPVPIKFATGVWSSPQPLSAIASILLQEQLGYVVEEVFIYGGFHGQKTLAGCCAGASCDTTDCIFEAEDGSTYMSAVPAAMPVDKFVMAVDPPETNIMLETWVSYDLEMKMAKLPSIEGVGSTGYLANPGIYFQKHIFDSALQDGLVLSHADGLRSPLALTYFTNISTMTAAMNSLAPLFFKDSFLAGVDFIRPALGLCDTDSWELSQIEAHGFTCTDGWILAPACADDRDKCIPFITGNFIWNTIAKATSVKRLDLPIAVTWAGWFGEIEIVNRLGAYNFMHYAWKSDDTFLQLDLQMVYHPDWALEISQFQDLQKLAWSEIRYIDPNVHAFISKFTITQGELMEFMTKKKAGTAIHDLACEWVQANEATWRKWLPSSADCGAGAEFVPATHTCEACQVGSAKKFRTDAACTLCAPGTYTSKAGQLECTPCAPGSFAAKKGSTARCTPCAVGFFAEVAGTTRCTPCGGDMTTQYLGSTAPGDCGCGPGSYLTRDGCAACDEAMLTCPGFTAAPKTKPGFQIILTGDGETGFAVPNLYRCITKGACPGALGGESQCATGAHGVACGKCKPDHYTSKSKCEPCSGSGGDVVGPLLLTIAVILCPVGLFAIYRLTNSPLTAQTSTTLAACLSVGSGVTAFQT